MAATTPTDGRRPRESTFVERAWKFGRAVLHDPVEAALYVPEHWNRRAYRKTDYQCEPEWLSQLHGWLGAPWPCDCADELGKLWERVLLELNSQGLAVGRFTTGNYSDGDLNLATAAWAPTRHGRPDIVVETGVARGLTTRVVLEGLERLGSGGLWSVDLPHPFEPAARRTTAAAVPDGLHGRWRLVIGSSRRRLPTLTAQLGHVDLFVHDSLHTARNVLFEMNVISRVLRVGGLMIIDDITVHEAFKAFAGSRSDYRTMACRSADGAGAFGVAQRVR